ncbi:MAG: hypothetical protein O2943_05535 [Actinomycetota bacterium]|nr:hypothetical protein [Actinomycetota bacterium]
MKRPVTSFVLALVSVILSPILIFIEYTALFLAAMITYEPSNPPVVKVLSIAVVVAIALVALVIPVIALRAGIRARSAAKSTQTKGAGLATAAVVIAGLVTVGVLAAQVYVLLMSFGSCSLDGC